MYLAGIISGSLMALLAGGGRPSVKGIIAGLFLAVLVAAPAHAQGETVDSGRAAEITAMTAVTGSHAQAAEAQACRTHDEEAEREFGFGVDAGFFSKYVSRGMTLSDDPVFQPDVWVSYSDLTLSVWGNMDLTDYNGNEGEFNELDFTLDYTRGVGMLELSAGGIYYVFPNTGGKDTAELYAAAGLDVLLKPTVTVFYDFLEADGVYCVLSVGHCFELPVPSEMIAADLELSAQAGWGSSNFNSFNAGSDRDALTDLYVTACLPVTMGENFTVSPMIAYSTALDKTIRKNNSYNDQIIWGATVSASF